MKISNSSQKVKYLVQAAVIAAAYTAISYSGFAFAYGPLQFRYSEALIAFAALTPAAVPGLTIGCMLSNIGSAYQMFDIIFGSLATFLAAIFAYLFRHVRIKKLPVLSLFGNVIFNALIISGMIVLVSPTPVLFWLTFVQIFASEMIASYALGLPLFYMMEKVNQKYRLF